MKIALFYRLWFDGGEKFLQSAAKAQIDLVPICYDDLVLKQDHSSFDIFYQGQPLSNFGLFYFRAVGSAEEWAWLLIAYARDKKIPLVDQYLLEWGPNRRLKSIAGTIISQKKIKYPKTILTSSRQTLLKEEKKLSYPLILKVSKGGRHGMGTFLVQNHNQFEKIIKGRIERSSFLAQEYIPNDGDYRLFLVGYQVVAGFKRQAKEDKMRFNRSLGASFGLSKIPPKIAALATKAAKALKIEICAVDLVVDLRTGKPIIIEANEAPEFWLMEKRTGVNICEKILAYLVKKAKK